LEKAANDTWNVHLAGAKRSYPLNASDKVIKAGAVFTFYITTRGKKKTNFILIQITPPRYVFQEWKNAEEEFTVSGFEDELMKKNFEKMVQNERSFDLITRTIIIR
jgi:hypothetical protein